MSTITHDQAVFGHANHNSAPNVLDRFVEWNRQRRTISRITRELNTYSDRQLADLGLSRGDIYDVARGRITR